MSTVTREELIEGSLNYYVRAGLVARGFGPAGTKWKMEESYPYDTEKLTINIIAAGFAFDDGGRQAELGSNLKVRQHTAEFFVFGLTNTWARNLANAIKFTLEHDQNGMVPLLDVTQPPTPPIIDYLYLDHVHSHKQPLPEPEPWQEFTWITVVQVTDYYYPPDM